MVLDDEPDARLLLTTILREQKAEVTAVASVDPVAKVVTSTDGRSWNYDVLLTTMPLNRLIARMESVPDPIRAAARGLHAMPAFHRDLVCGIAVSALDFLRGAPPLDCHLIRFAAEPA